MDDSVDMIIKTCDMHTAGEPVRIVTGGYPELSGDTILQKRKCASQKYDIYRQILMNEPRGHKDMYGAILVEPSNPKADIGVLFIQNEGYSSMCGHAVIALGRYAIDNGYVEAKYPETVVNIECPCGIVTANVEYNYEKSGAVRFHSVPAFAYLIDADVKSPRFGNIKVDISYGGAFYGIFSVTQISMDLTSTPLSVLIEAATDVSDAIKSQIRLSHPDSEDLAFLYGIILTDGKDDSQYTRTKNICIFADRAVDRSPTGSGVTARMALQFKKNQVTVGVQKEFESILGTTFKGKVVRETKCGKFDAVIVEVSGRAFYTGEHTFRIEKEDPFPRGFTLL